jgi:hypothetical protein
LEDVTVTWQGTPRANDPPDTRASTTTAPPGGIWAGTLMEDGFDTRVGHVEEIVTELTGLRSE